jgi:hypothetical protein
MENFYAYEEATTIISTTENFKHKHNIKQINSHPAEAQKEPRVGNR